MKMPSAYKHNHLSVIAFNIRHLHIAKPGIMGDRRPPLLPETKRQLRDPVIAFTQIGRGVNRKTIIQSS
jgi:hypothetical protein